MSSSSDENYLERQSSLITAFRSELAHRRGLSEHTVRNYCADIRHLCTYCEHHVDSQPLEQLTLRDLRAWVMHQKRAGLAATTIGRRIAAVKALYAFCVRTGRMQENPALRLVTPQKSRRLPAVIRQTHMARVFSDDAVEAITLRDRAMVELLYATGMRVSELVALDTDALDLANNMVTVMGKGRKERRIPFGIPAREAMQAWLSYAREQFVKDSTPATDRLAVFLGKRGKRIDQRQVRDVVHAATAREPSEPELAPHGLRHSAATHMVENGADIRQVQEYLGHSSLASTQLYTQVSLKHLTERYQSAHPRA